MKTDAGGKSALSDGLGQDTTLDKRLGTLVVFLLGPDTSGWAPEVRRQAVAVANEAQAALTKAKTERQQFRALLEEWHEGEYSGGDFLRRVKLALNIGKPIVSLASPKKRGA